MHPYEPPYPLGMLHKFILDVKKVFYHLAKLWMGIRVHPYTLMPVQVRNGFLENWGMVEHK